MTDNGKNGFCILPTLASTLSDTILSDIMVQQNNASTMLENEWVHIAFVANPENPSNTTLTNKSSVDDIEDQLPRLPAL